METSCSRHMKADKPSSSHQISRPSPSLPRSRAGRVGSPQPRERLRSYAPSSLISQPAPALNPDRSKDRSGSINDGGVHAGRADPMPHGSRNDSAVAHTPGRGNRTSGPSRRWDGAAPDANRPMNEVSHEL